MKITKASAKRILDLWKDQSPLYRGEMSIVELEYMLRAATRVGKDPLFTQADVLVITMALKLAGAKIEDSTNDVN